jgi:hypothetical protein
MIFFAQMSFTNSQRRHFLQILSAKTFLKSQHWSHSESAFPISPETHHTVIKPIWTTDRGMVTSPNHKSYRHEEPRYQGSIL